MAVTISGTLRNASGVRPNTKIILTATRTSNTVLQHAPDISITTDANGEYSFDCNPTAYVLSIQQDGYRREVVGAIMVYSDSVPGTLEDFILAPKAPDLTPEIVKQVEELRNEAAQFASQAADSAQEAKDAAASIGNASIEHGSWDASSSDFPVLDGKSNWYRISVGGTLTSPTQDDMTVMVGDMIYYSTVDLKWYKIDNSESIDIWRQYCRKESEVRQMIQGNTDRFAASQFVHYGTATSDNQRTPINEGLFTRVTVPNQLHMGQLAGATRTGESKTLFSRVCVAGFVSDILFINNDNLANKADGNSRIKLPQAPDGTVTYDSATGAVVKHADAATAFAAETATNKVVTERVDMYGAEFGWNEINDANPDWFPYGMTQSKITSIDGISTTPSDKPIEWFAVYDGDTASRGQRVDFMAATDEVKSKLVSTEGNNTFQFDDGTIKQWVMWQTSIAGLGNGDWFNINPATGNLEFADGIPVMSRNNKPFVQSSEAGVFEDGAGNFFMVWGTQERLNQGVKAPINDIGAAKATDGFWYQSSLINTLEDCFLHATGGDITSGVSGRDDGRFYDIAYAGGQGGVVDVRLSSWDAIQWWRDINDKCKSSQFRGVEKLKKIISNGSAVNESEINISVSGEFSLDVIYGSPSDIQATFPNGKGGVYGGVAMGENTSLHDKHKCLDSSVKIKHTTNNGATWVASTSVVNEQNNTSNIPSTGVSVVTYTAYAAITAPSQNANMVDLGDVFSQNSHEISKGALLRESASESVAKGTKSTNLQILRHDIENGKVTDYETMAYTPESGSKLLQSQLVEDNGQLFIQYHDGSNYHRTAMPIGYALKQAKAGSESSNQPAISFASYYSHVLPPSH